MKFRLALDGLKLRDVDSGFMSRIPKFALFNAETRCFCCFLCVDKFTLCLSNQQPVICEAQLKKRKFFEDLVQLLHEIDI